MEWRLNLKENDEVDLCDSNRVWISSTVYKRREEKNKYGEICPLIFIGYRIYDENGDCYDE